MEKEQSSVPEIKGYKVKEEIGKGGFGIVYSVINTKDEKFAMKIVNKDVGIKEFEAHKGLTHGSIIKIQDMVEFTEDGKEKIALIMDLAHTNLHKVIMDKKSIKGSAPEPFREKERLELFYHLLEGVKYIHLREISHRDIKPENIFLTEDNIVKLGDFGISTLVENQRITRSKYYSCGYDAPEIHKEGNLGATSLETDIWALGIIIYEMFTFKLPFGERGGNQEMRNLRNFDKEILEGKASKPFIKLISQMLHVDKNKRLKIQQVIEIFDEIYKEENREIKKHDFQDSKIHDNQDSQPINTIKVEENKLYFKDDAEVTKKEDFPSISTPPPQKVEELEESKENEDQPLSTSSNNSSC